MKLNVYKRFLTAILLGGILITSCKKIEEVDPLGSRGQTIVKLVGGALTDTPFIGAQSRPIDYIATSQSVIVADVRRDVPNATELNRPMTFVISHDTAFLTKYNVQRDSAGLNPILPLDPTWYTVVTGNGVEYTGTGGTYTITLAPGEHSKEISIIVPDATVLDVSAVYGIPFTIVSTDPAATISEKQTLIALVSAKNKYDGVYSVTGTMVDFVNPAFSGNYPRTYYLVTAGPNSVHVMQIINGELVPGYLFLNAGAGTYFGLFGLTVFFDPATDEIESIHNYYGNPANPANGVGDPSGGTGAPDYVSSNTRSAVLDPSGINAYDPVAKKVDIKYFLIQTNQPTGTTPRSAIAETWTYTGPR